MYHGAARLIRKKGHRPMPPDELVMNPASSAPAMQTAVTSVVEPVTVVRGACPHDCPDTCATLTEVQGGRAVRFYADAAHPITDGWLCAKVRPYLERVYSPDRLLYPMRRVGPKGGDQWECISWEEAVGEIAGRWRRILAAEGGAAILP